jgi:hypothetical protein
MTVAAMVFQLGLAGFIWLLKIRALPPKSKPFTLEGV